MRHEPQDLKLLRERVESWTKRLALAPRLVRIQKMSRKWGSCSTTGTITLAEDVAALDKGWQDVVIVHELLHLRVRNHGRVFRALMSLHVPHWRGVELVRRTK
jgi:predicted metal-dependent hydrolase